MDQRVSLGFAVLITMESQIPLECLVDTQMQMVILPAANPDLWYKQMY